MSKRHLSIGLVAAGALFILIVGGYTTWNAMDPAHTCAQCHEIRATHEAWLTSAHKEIACTDCHGTALSEGLHSVQEKTRMVVSYWIKDIRNEDIRLNERQILAVADRRAGCHRSEHAGWLSGGHSATYRDIYLDEAHNRMEKPYADCFRCHGMFYDGAMKELMTLEGEPDTYLINDRQQADRAVVPCLACHQIHTETGDVPKTSVYVRAEKSHLRTDHLSKPVMYEQSREVLTSDDPNTLLCLQCHAPNAWRQAGSEDDRTPTGVHEGLSCLACHSPHSQDTRHSCTACHPALSNCGLDVMTMNTTYLDKNSPNNIHHISCASCHEEPLNRQIRAEPLIDRLIRCCYSGSDRKVGKHGFFTSLPV